MTDLVTAASFREPWEAHMFCGLLRSQGVPAFVAHEYHVWNNWPYSTALGGVKVQVPADHFGQALSIEHGSRRGEFQALLTQEFGDLASWRRPVCSSTDCSRRRPALSTVIAICGSFLLRTLLPACGWIYTCKNCGAKSGS